MKGLRVFIGLITLLIIFPINFYMGFLLYSHVRATELMWFLFWFSWPLTFIVSAISTIVDKMIEKK